MTLEYDGEHCCCNENYRFSKQNVVYPDLDEHTYVAEIYN
jgi:hypothetical protein